MKHKKAILIVTISAAACGVLGHSYLSKSIISKKGIIATISSVTDIPNAAEDGYYGFQVKTVSGKKYYIDATGHRNSPERQDDQGPECLDVPEVKVGDIIKFNLPTAEDASNTFETCYPQGSTGFYFVRQTVENPLSGFGT